MRARVEKRSVLGWNKSLPGSFIIHPNPLFCYKDLSRDTTKKLKLASITPQEGATVRCIISASPLKGKEEYIIILLSLYTQNPDSPLYPKDLPPKPSSYTPSIPYLSPKISFLNISNWSNKTPPHPSWTQHFNAPIPYGWCCWCIRWFIIQCYARFVSNF